MNCPIEDNSWLDARQIEQTGSLVEELMDHSHDFLLPESLMQEHPAEEPWLGVGFFQVEELS